MSIRELMSKVETKAKTQKVAMPEWGFDVYVRSVSWETILKYQKLEAAGVNCLTQQVAEFLCDEEGKAIYSIEEHEQLGKFSLGELRKIINAAAEVNDLSSRIDDVKKK